MADATPLTGINHRPLNLRGYRPAPIGASRTCMVVSESQSRRQARRLRREEAERRRLVARRRLITKVILVAILGIILGLLALSRMGSPYGGAIPEGGRATVRGANPAPVTEPRPNGVMRGAFAGQGNAAGWPEPDIAGDCPILWHRSDDGSFLSNNGACLPSGCAFGVDVSEHDGTIDWEAAKEGGVEFAIIRCGFGTDDVSYDDACWEYNASECERLGIPYGAYLYSYATDPDSAVYEAEHAIRLVSGHAVPLGVWYDIEEGSQAEALGYDEELFDRLVDNFAATVEAATGAEVGVYTSRSWLDGHMSKVAADAEHPIWCACWTDGAPEGYAYEYWQAGAASIPGFDSDVDFDVVLAA